MAEQTKKRLMTTDKTSKISENPKKKKQIRHSDEGKQFYGKCGPVITVYHR